MSATVQIRRLTGSGPTSTDITSINTRANAADAHTTADTASPISVPSGADNYSYWVVTQLNATVAPSVLINNLRWYTDGSNSLGTGVTMNVNTASGYVQATGTPAVTGDELTTGAYASLAGAPSDAFAYTSGSPLTVTGTQAGTGAFGDRVVYQVVVASTAAPGATTQETITWKWDEI